MTVPEGEGPNSMMDDEEPEDENDFIEEIKKN